MIWHDCVEHFRNEVGPNFQDMKRDQVKNLIYNTQKNVLGGDAITVVENKSPGPKDSAFL